MNPLARTPLALAAALLWSPLGASAQASAPADERQLPLVLEADELRGRPDLDFVAEGKVLLQRGRLRLSTDRLEYDNVADRASARGNVRIETNDGNWFAGPELSLVLGRFEGWFTRPEYFFARTQAGGRAERIDFIDDQRAQLTRADYTSCTRDGAGMPAWLMSTERVKLDFEANEGIAEGAVLRLLGVPILAAPVLTFPLTDERKSGWLPPTFNLDSKSGLEVAVPWYWNIAPQRDATFTPIVYTRRGIGLLSEGRYLERAHQRRAALALAADDRVFGQRALRARSGSRAARPGPAARRLRWRHEGLRVSDDVYWKDFGRAPERVDAAAAAAGRRGRARRCAAGASTPRPTRACSTGRCCRTPDPQALIVAPYHRAPQIGWRGMRPALATRAGRRLRGRGQSLRADAARPRPDAAP